jgi:hypothetical protein
MTTKITKVISYIFHPIFMPIIGVYIILQITHLALLPDVSKNAILYLIGISTILFPLTIIPLLYYRKIITNITISDKKERLIPLFLTSIFYYISYYMLHKFSAPLFIQEYILTVFFNVLFASIISIKWKISLHMIGIGGLVGLMSSLFYLFNINIGIILPMLILVSGVIGTSRIYLKEHNSSQIYFGFFLGYLTSFVSILFLNL